MHLKSYFRAAFLTALSVLSFHVVGTILFLYSYYWWYDIPLHWLGGLSAGFTSLAIMSRAGRFVSRPFGVALVGAFIFGVFWELFEYYAGITQNTIGSYPLDTLKDLGMDVLGGCTAFVTVVIYRHQNKLQ